MSGRDAWIALMRHYPTAWNDRNLIQGRQNVPLTPASTAALRSLQLPARIAAAERCLASPLARAVETASLLWPGHIETDPRLIETDWGAWEGKRLADLRAADPEGMKAAEARGLDLSPPGGERPRAVMGRLSGLLAELGAARATAFVVTHKGVLRAALALASGWDMTQKAPVRLERGTVHLFRLEADGAISLVEANIPLEPRQPA
ncbi:histidine phosphatase family protein [Futiania mangrovi]|uniref:Histidine phosphatase family protein n=1 Tax=Futiania mangrovi TaxID=2959716 RepID=A0A9J6PJ07_9PROT|nr:histidine phosphatase family protein [Futiania mangrovii]MCP1336535.1 histidine phosphatase family protein [Futiania mangrovii]